MSSVLLVLHVPNKKERERERYREGEGVRGIQTDRDTGRGREREREGERVCVWGTFILYLHDTRNLKENKVFNLYMNLSISLKLIFFFNESNVFLLI